MKPSAFKQLLGFDKKRLWFYCPCCESRMGDFGDANATAQFFDDGQNPTISCVVCEESTKVMRRKCHNPECESTVHTAGDEGWEETCRLCGADENYLTRKMEEERIFGLRQTWQLPPEDPFPDNN